MSNQTNDELYEFPISTRKLSDEIALQLEALIARGEFALDAPLPPERQLMERFNTSRTVIREAISNLANQGLLDVRRHHRPIVRQPNSEAAIGALGGIVKHLMARKGGVKQLYQLRIFCERMLVREAANVATKTDIRRLKDALSANEAQIPYSRAFYETDIAFHGALYEITSNPIFASIHEAFTAWLSPKWAQMERSPGRNRRNFAAHQAIYQAILERDPDLAEQKLIAHLDSAWQDVKDKFGYE